MNFIQNMLCGACIKIDVGAWRVNDPEQSQTATVWTRGSRVTGTTANMFQQQLCRGSPGSHARRIVLTADGEPPREPSTIPQLMRPMLSQCRGNVKDVAPVLSQHRAVSQVRLAAGLPANLLPDAARSSPRSQNIQICCQNKSPVQRF